MSLKGEAKRKANREAYLRRKGLKGSEAGSEGLNEREGKASHPNSAPPDALPDMTNRDDLERVLSPREERLAALLASGKYSVVAACREAGYSVESHGVYRRLKNPDNPLYRRIRSLMRAHGLTLDVPILKIREMYDATKEIPNPALSKPGAHLAAMAAGQTVPETIQIKDNEAQRWAVEQHLKLEGAYPKDDKADGSSRSGPVSVSVVFEGMPSPTNGNGSGRGPRLGVKVEFER